MSDARSPTDVIDEQLDRYPTTTVAEDIIDALHDAGYVIERGWQPIETAPDRKRAVFWLPEHYELPGTAVVGAWRHDLNEWHGRCYRSAPTHWRPLPAPPETPDE